MNRRKFVMRVGQVVVAVSVVLTCSLSEGQQSVAVLIAYHSATGNTEKMTQGVAEGARPSPGRALFSNGSPKWQAATLLPRMRSSSDRRFTSAICREKLRRSSITGV